ncbi:unnamed protein product, partial [marine sediment metagenome]
VLGALLGVFGGPAAIAALVKIEYDALPPCHPNRLKLLMLILSSMFRFGDEGGGPKNLEAAEEQLTALLKQQDAA